MFTKNQGGEGRVGGGVCALQSNQSSSVAAGLGPSDQRAGSGQAFQSLLCAGNVSGQVGEETDISGYLLSCSRNANPILSHSDAAHRSFSCPNERWALPLVSSYALIIKNHYTSHSK